MKIVILTGSPRTKGTSSLLVDRFTEGAARAGHEVFRFDAAFKEVKGCRGCYACIPGGECVWKDDMEDLYEPLLAADYVVFATGLYYFGFPSHIKSVIDRFHSINDRLQGADKKTILFATCADTDKDVMRGLVATYEEIVKYEKWKDTARLVVYGVGERADIEKTDYPEKAYRLGQNIE